MLIRPNTPAAEAHTRKVVVIERSIHLLPRPRISAGTAFITPELCNSVLPPLHAGRCPGGGTCDGTAYMPRYAGNSVHNC